MRFNGGGGGRNKRMRFNGGGGGRDDECALTATAEAAIMNAL